MCAHNKIIRCKPEGDPGDPCTKTIEQEYKVNAKLNPNLTK